MYCIACKNAISDESCRIKQIPGFLYCGIHLKSKNVRIWADVHNVNKKIIQVQKWVRGFLCRNWLKQCGIGCLKRNLCHNEEELITLESASKIPPFDFFSFEENGKLWWFDFRSIYQIIRDTHKPLNPYTRQPLPIEARRRLREIIIRRQRYRLPLSYENNKIDLESYINISWCQICQVLEENGFEDVTPEIFQLNARMFKKLLALIIQDLKILAMRKSRYQKYVLAIQNTQKNLINSKIPQLPVSKTFFSILHDLPNSYIFCFILMSALQRL